MKVIKKTAKEIRSVTLRISKDVMRKVDEVAGKNDVSRQRLIESILKQVLYDKNFTLMIEE